MRIGLRQLHKRFGATSVIDQVSLAVASGELLALLGPSGSGKTTLLRIIGGLERPDAGQVLFDDDDTASWPIQRRRVGFVFQHYALFQHLSVRENVAFGLRALPRRERPDRARIDRRVDELLALMRLEETAARYPSQLSGGQQQRVALARALAIDPRVLLLDEPFGALDAQVRKDLRRWLRRIHDSTGLTTVLVTHDQDEALELADRVAVMHAGRLVQVGTPDEIFERPATRFVHEFVGESSALPVMIHGGRVHHEGRALDLIARAAPDGAADLLFRPQHVELCEASASAIAARVVAVSRAGSRFRIDAVAGAEETRVELECARRPALARGDWAHFKPTQWHLYARGEGGQSVEASEHLLVREEARGRDESSASRVIARARELTPG